MRERAVEDSVSFWPEQLRGWKEGLGEASRVRQCPQGSECVAAVSKTEMGFLSCCVQIVVSVHLP